MRLDYDLGEPKKLEIPKKWRECKIVLPTNMSVPSHQVINNAILTGVATSSLPVDIDETTLEPLRINRFSFLNTSELKEEKFLHNLEVLVRNIPGASITFEE